MYFFLSELSMIKAGWKNSILEGRNLRRTLGGQPSALTAWVEKDEFTLGVFAAGHYRRQMNSIAMTVMQSQMDLFLSFFLFQGTPLSPNTTTYRLISLRRSRASMEVRSVSLATLVVMERSSFGVKLFTTLQSCWVWSVYVHLWVCVYVCVCVHVCVGAEG